MAVRGLLELHVAASPFINTSKEEKFMNDC